MVKIIKHLMLKMKSVYMKMAGRIVILGQSLMYQQTIRNSEEKLLKNIQRDYAGSYLIITKDGIQTICQSGHRMIRR